MLFKFLFPVLFIAGLYFLIKSIGRILAVYSGKKIEFSASDTSIVCQLDKPGAYEVAYKRPGLFGVIPTDIAFKMHSQPDGNEVIVSPALNVLGSRKDMSGNRIVPVAEFSIEVAGSYELFISNIPARKEGDRLIITEKTDTKAFLMLFAILLSAIATIAGLVLSILAFLNKL
ncbi:MAG: hypothetical protein ABIN80_17390 [Dyadobacter sp.]|uniref:hypothetical protein n=1 Tax=Dyadobacter sp. TaxID=1914288 RepID=UPI0032637F14